MADASDNVNSCKWFCHSCNSEIFPDLSEFKCPVCEGGFIEPVEEEISSNESTISSSEEEDVRLSSAANQRPGPMAAPRVEGAAHNESSISFSFQSPFGLRNPLPSVPQNPFDGFHGFVEQLMFGLMGGLNTGAATFSIQMGPQTFEGNTGDYVFSAEGLDNIVTMLMNQLDGAGPPPAPKEQVDALPYVAVTQAQVDDKLQCHVCMENFHLDEKVKELPCRHVYHCDCIVPWLQLHGTCPVCRKRIDATNPNDSAFHSTDSRT